MRTLTMASALMIGSSALCLGVISAAFAADTHPSLMAAPAYTATLTGRNASPEPRAVNKPLVSDLLPNPSNQPLTKKPLTARGIVRAGEQINISAPLALRVTHAPYRAGETVARGADLARFDCTRMRADLAARKSAIETLNIRYRSEQDLAAYGANGAYDVALAQSERDQARAEARALQASLRDCVIKAPFQAQIQARHIAPHETPPVGAPLYSLIRAGDHEISIIVPAALGASLEMDQEFEFQTDINDARFAVRIIRLAPDIDPVSQTLEIIAKPVEPMRLRPGMSGHAVFGAPQTRAADAMSAR